MNEVQDIFARHGSDFLSNNMLGANQLKAYRAILHCRTAVLGSHVDVCGECGHQEISYNSCRNRHCPKCQTFAKEQWIEKQEQSLLNIGYFHVVFSLPDELNPVMFQNQETLYNLFFKAATETLLELGYNKKYLGAKLGVTAVMHTWGQRLNYHPHIHCIVTGGGLTGDGRWLNSRKKFFIPVKVLSKKFRGKFLAYLQSAKLNFYGAVDELNIPGNFKSFIAGLYRKQWVTYCKPPFENASKVIRYLGRYTHRVAISNNRIIKLENGYVTFTWRDYTDSNKVKEMTLSAQEFIRRFMMHILPSRFCKIRHYGILASKNKSATIDLCKKLTNTAVFNSAEPRDILDALREWLGNDFNLCPRCRKGRLIRSPQLSRASPA